QEHVTAYNGLPTVEKLKLLSQREGLPHALHEAIKRLKRKYTNDKVNALCRPNYGKQLTLTYLKEKGYIMACCSNSQKYSLMNMLQRSHLDMFFTEIIGNDEGFRPKPSPEIYLEAFKRLNIKANEAIIVEDAPHGIAAAKASGAKVFEVGGFDDVNLDLFINAGL
ncbi:MAG: HAD-IA family hydrolase, partial [Patescibacteria group bacterium]|nr:HAD-IA family hydrolase [Patescibacteria group bacterium]